MLVQELYLWQIQVSSREKILLTIFIISCHINIMCGGERACAKSHLLPIVSWISLHLFHQVQIPMVHNFL